MSDTPASTPSVGDTAVPVTDAAAVRSTRPIPPTLLTDRTSPPKALGRPNPSAPVTSDVIGDGGGGAGTGTGDGVGGDGGESVLRNMILARCES